MADRDAVQSTTNPLQFGDRTIRMTLARKTALSLLSVAAGLLATAVASLWGLWVLNDLTSATHEEFAELSNARALERQLWSASAALSEGQRADALSAIAGVVKKLHEYIDDQLHEDSTLGGEHTRREVELSRSALRALEPMQAALAATPDAGPATVTETREFLAAQRALWLLADEFELSIERVQQTTAKRFNYTFVSLAALSAAIVVLLALISVRHYRSVVGPLTYVRDGVGRLAAGELRTRLEPRGDAEFVGLQNDFNRMATELESLYTNLEQRVSEQGKRLAVSERLASVGFLAAGVAHEINNPLAIMSGHAEGLLRRLREPQSDPDRHAIVSGLEIIRDEAFRCSGITRELLDLSRAGDQHRAPVSLWNVMESVAVMTRMAPQCEGVHIETSGDRRDALVVSASEPELKQVLLNLTMNAVQAVGRPSGRVELIAKRNNGWIEACVHDNGCGMSVAVLERVFEPFFTTRRGQPGVGLGLAVSHAIVRRHNGELLAQSDGPGRGSTFIMRLPALKES